MKYYAVIISLLLLFSHMCAASVYETLKRGHKLEASGNYVEAVAQYDSIISIDNLRNSIKFETLGARAKCHKMLGNYELALNDYNNALRIDASAINKIIIALNKSDLLIQTGSYKDAEFILKEIKDLNDDIRLRRVSNLASVYVKTGRFDMAEELYKSLLDKESDNVKSAITIQNLGFLYMHMGRWSHAVQTLKEACSLFDKLTKDYAIALSNLALSQAFNHDFDNAVNNIRLALDQLNEILGKEHPDYITALRKKGEIYLFLNDHTSAAESFKEYYNLTLDNLLPMFDRMTTQWQLDYWKKERPLLSLAFGIENEAPDLLLDIALFRRALATKGKGNASNNILSIRGKEIQNALHHGEVAVDFVVYPKRDDSGKLLDFIGAIITKKDGISFVRLGEISDFENFPICNTTLKQAISSGNYNHIDAIYTDARLAKLIWFQILNKLGDDKSITDIYFVPDGFLNLLAAEYLPGLPENINIHRLTNLSNIVSYTKEINDNSFLLVGGLDYDSITEWNKSSNGINHLASEFLSRNNPDFYFSQLPGMRDEVIRINEVFPKAIRTDDMPEEKFKSDAGKYKRLHISSHGYTLHLPDNKPQYLLSDSIEADNSLLASGLVLSGANIAYRYKNRDDGLLSARELCDLDLTGVEYIALSACQTADGKVCDEGPAGLVRGLKKAGVKTIVATLWEVNDEATALFMTKFYELMTTGLSKGAAFRNAREYLRQYKIVEPEIIAEFDPALQSTRYLETGSFIETYPMKSPAFWAPFILIDNIEH